MPNAIYATSSAGAAGRANPPKEAQPPALTMTPAAAAAAAAATSATTGAEVFSEAEKHAAEKHATAPMPPPPVLSSSSTSGAKQRSCLTCRQRKVRCDRLSPCSNCRRAEIPCVYPTAEKPPRWARRLRQQQQPRELEQQTSQPSSYVAENAFPGVAQQAYDMLPRPSLPHSRTARDARDARDALASAQSGSSTDVGAVLDRLMALEALVRELSSAYANPGTNPSLTAASASASPSTVQPRPTPHDQNTVNAMFGRLILDDDNASRSRYVSSGFWSKINDELDALREETGSLAELGSVGDDDSDLDDDEPRQLQPWPTSSAQEPQRTPTDRHAFLFGHNIRPPLGDLPDYRPLPSQIPFLFQVYVANVNGLIQIVHVPTMNKTIERLLGDAGDDKKLDPANEALFFAIYYAAVASMDDEDATKSFALSKADLLLKYRLGLELALAKADFLDTSDLSAIQALLIFLVLVRRHDSPRFVWMLTGLAIRMGQSLGLQRDGSNFTDSLTPFEVEMRRRVWWTLCALDVRSSEDQGTDLTIMPNTYDTRLPLNINDADIGPDTKQMPEDRDELTDMTYALLSFEITRLAQRMMALAASTPPMDQCSSGPSQQPPRGSAMTPRSRRHLLEEQGRMLDEVYQKLDSVYLRHAPDTNGIVYWTGVTIARLVMAKMSLILYLPTLLGQEQQEALGGEELRTRLLSSAIEVAEYNHALMVERACRRWRWLFDTYTQWHAIAFLLMETARRSWDPAVERGWVALHSPYLIPPHILGPGLGPGSNRADAFLGSREPSVGASSVGVASTASSSTRTQHFWLPLRRLLARSRRHRAAELVRLRADARAAHYLEATFDVDVAEGRSRPLSNPASVDLFRSRWRKLVGLDVSASPAPSAASADAVPRYPQPKPSMTAAPPPDMPPSVLLPPLPATVPTAAHSGAAIDLRATGLAASTAQPSSAYRNDTDREMLRGNSNYDPWRLWTGIDVDVAVSANAFGGSEIVNDPSIMIDEDIDMDVEVETDIDWGNWLASVQGFERSTFP